MTTKEIQEKVIANMKKWQDIENATVAHTGRIISKTDNAVIKIIVEIIQRDSKMHHRIQCLISESLESKTISLSPDELGEIWDLVEKHIQMEQETINLAKESLQALRGKKMVVQEYLLDYLRLDEEKHNQVLEILGTIKKGMYPYG
ncbi:hypothetical protein ACFLSX_00285 [Calditrichota bacterium]